VTWLFFRIPQSIPIVQARWVAKTTARLNHSKFETIVPWLRYHLEHFLAEWVGNLEVSCVLWHVRPGGTALRTWATVNQTCYGVTANQDYSAMRSGWRSFILRWIVKRAHYSAPKEKRLRKKRLNQNCCCKRALYYWMTNQKSHMLLRLESRGPYNIIPSHYS